MKYSNQREIIYHIVQEGATHPTADAVYTAAKKLIPKLSLATVYRNLATLTQAGLIQKLNVPGGAEHYDANVKKHYHFFCGKCGRVFDIRMQVEELLEDVENSSGHKITEANIHLRGICRECLESEKNACPRAEDI